MRRILLSFLSLLAISPLAGAVELMKWERIPLPVPLHVSQERIIFVDKNVRVGLPPSLDGKLRIQSTGGAVYLLASEAFPATRLQLQDTASGELLLLDISARSVPENTRVMEPVRLVYSGEVVSQGGKTTPGTAGMPGQASPAPTAASSRGSAPAEPRSTVPAPVALTRYAAQRLYAPARTVDPLPGVKSVAHGLPARLTTLFPGEPLAISPLAAWQLAGYTVVALKVRHTAAGGISPDPRLLQGQFVSATFQHAWLGPAGLPEDTTALYLVMKGKPDAAFIPEPACQPAGKKTRPAGASPAPAKGKGTRP
ncbi:TIGR03749 family integrating conjugative element protein [Klebsiella oxytoca]|uniref:TIGR03749 family integrating conjugative element protein n=1 Tax=Klebsiella oxytoca TaxID=571 RepID=UPI00384B31C5